MRGEPGSRSGRLRSADRRWGRVIIGTDTGFEQHAPNRKRVVRNTNTCESPMRFSCVMDAIVGCVMSLLLSQRCLSAPQIPGSQRSESGEGGPALTLANPFGSSEEERRLLQSYITDHLKDSQGSPDLNTWEQEIFFLFSLHDYDKSGQMDGLELMKLLSDFLSHHSMGPQSADSVVSVVDALLQTQDLNQDGMLDPSELLTLPVERHPTKPQLGVDAGRDNTHDAPAQPAEEAPPQQWPIDRALDPRGAEVLEPDGKQQQEAGQTRGQDLSPGEDRGPEPPQLQDQAEQLQRDHVPEPQAQERVEQQRVPAHQGQPEM
ncbi:hypothetical protein AAFF_G00361720 [Aldrovandia affinis]|uniref:EF-hand domain-containing protein n=1 Tax=Aldrovandia affinis TaxID=143900 RepID=A0AAD7SIC9_9TELE|nr:hypothetical protein AAFF_G00361720 [Aldrovandia affinis]